MSEVWFTADTHLDHVFVAKLRGFADTAEHDAAVVDRWNAVVRPGDVVWHLGDVGMGRLTRFSASLTKLHGTIHLITGNHDECWSGLRDGHKRQRAWLEHCDTVQPYARRRVAGRNVMLCHFPYDGDHVDGDRHTQYRLRDEGLPLLCGHVHDAWAVSGRQMNVGVDVRGFAPVHLDEVAQLVETLD